jgi:hypothetical protein
MDICTDLVDDAGDVIALIYFDWLCQL